ncbi:YncE family protein [Actinomadura sp. WMMA1423]|uniref:YncE family protein n=1 Tax=Actinomadura sp. WMMA1423 TaxID=2591108 RepID=UPI0011471988|nr:YncE family protein [Actinomadura sp. WMMA1423]
MQPRRRRSRAAAFPLAAALSLTGLAGCESPVPFYRPGEGTPDDPVVGLGGPAPYLPSRPGGPAPRASGSGTPRGVPVAPAGGQVYAATGPGMLAPAARGLPPRLYVPNGPFVDVLDPTGLRLAGRLLTGATASRVVPSWDLRRLWATDRAHGLLVPLAPRTGRRGRPVGITAPTGLYFSPDGRDALVLARRPDRLDLRDPRTMAPRATTPLPCAAGHADFTPDEASLVATCTAAGVLARVHLASRTVSGTIRLPAGARPGDLRLSPDGSAFYVADARQGGVWLVDARRFALLGFVRTGRGARGLAISRDARRLFVVGRGDVTAVEFGSRRIASRWPLPGGGPADPGGVSSDGRSLWLADPAGLVYALSTRNGRVLQSIRIGGRPAGPCVHPQPGRYSLGGTGLYR